MKKGLLNTTIFLLSEGCVLSGVGFLLNSFNSLHSFILLFIGIVSFIAGIAIAVIGLVIDSPVQQKNTLQPGNATVPKGRAIFLKKSVPGQQENLRSFSFHRKMQETIR
jgi:hypothetical protein